MGMRVFLALLVATLTGCLFESPERVAPGEELLDLADGGAVPEDIGDDIADDVEVGEDTEQDVADDVADASAPQVFSFTCEPACGDAEFCGPDSTCYRGAPSCTATNQTCDPATAEASETLFCEPAYDGSIGYCRRRCADGTECADGESCGAILPGSDVTICRRTCDSNDACLALDVCTATRFGFCRAGCVPFFDGQCSRDTQCFPIQADGGYCDVRGDVPVDDVCNVGEGKNCVEGALCLNTAAGARCIQGCNPAQLAVGSPGACAGERFVCGELQDRTLGICAQTCDIFDPELQCDGREHGCTFQGGTAGVCFHRGTVQEGRTCDGHQNCVGNLACVDNECRPLCLRTAGAGEDGACREGLRCRTLSGPTLGYCIE
jgi:hypothetical protein